MTEITGSPYVANGAASTVVPENFTDRDVCVNKTNTVQPSVAQNYDSLVLLDEPSGASSGKSESSIDLFEVPTISKPLVMIGLDAESNMLVEAATVLVMGAGAATQQNHLATLTNRMSSESADLKTIRDERVAEMLEAARETQKSKKLDGLTKALGALAVVASVLITACSLGSATPAAACLMVAGTALTTTVTIDGMTGGKLMSKIAGDNQWVALGLSIGSTLLGAGMVCAGGMMVSNAAKAASAAANAGSKSASSGTNAATSGETAAKAVGDTAKSGSAAGGEAASSASASAASKVLPEGSLFSRMIGVFQRNGMDVFDITSYTQRAQSNLQVAEALFSVGEAASSVPGTIAQYKAGLARADAHELGAKTTRVEATITVLEDYIEGASRSMSDNFEKMISAISMFRDANAQPFAG